MDWHRHQNEITNISLADYWTKIKFSGCLSFKSFSARYPIRLRMFYLMYLRRI